MISNIDAGVVYEGDHFVYKRGTSPLLEHTPDLMAIRPSRLWPAYDDRGEKREDIPNRYDLLRAFWSVINIRGAGCLVNVMSRDEMDKYRNRSRAAQDGPWVTDYDGWMGKKTSLKQNMKLAPKSIEWPKELGQAIALDSAYETGDLRLISGLFESPEASDLDRESEPIVSPAAAKESGPDLAKAAVAKPSGSVTNILDYADYLQSLGATPAQRKLLMSHCQAAHIRVGQCTAKAQMKGIRTIEALIEYARNLTEQAA